MKNSVISSELAQVLAPVSLVEATGLFKNENVILPSGYNNAVKSGNKIYGFVSNNFGLVKPMDVYETFGSEFDKYNLKFETKGKIDNRGNFELRWVFNMEKQNAKVKDLLNAMFSFLGGLAGSRKTQLKNGFERLICTNGMTSVNYINLMEAVKNTKKNHNLHFGIDFEKLLPLVVEFINSNSFIAEQTKLVEMELENEQILPFFYEITNETGFPESKFQDAFDRMKFEAGELGYTKMNRYLAYTGLNYILEHDSMSLDLVKTNSIDIALASRVETLDLAMAIKNFDSIAQAEKSRLDLYALENQGKSPRGKRKVLELV